jgi:hypothetical protein
MRNRTREICTSGSVRDEDGQPPHLLGRRNFLHLAAGAWSTSLQVAARTLGLEQRWLRTTLMIANATLG